MSPVIGRSLAGALLALIGVAGYYAWKPHPSSPSAATEPPPPAPRVQRPTHAIAPSHLAALTDPGRPWQVRIALLRNALQSECGEPELRYLYDVLTMPPPKGERPEHWYVIANECMEQLRRHDPDNERFSSSLLRLLHDPHQPLVLRDYAVQHLVTWLNPRSQQAKMQAADPAQPAPQPTPEITARVLQALVAATTDPALEQSSIPGTTLMMLVDLVRSPGEVDCRQAIATLKPWLTQALQDGSTLSTPVRVSAVQAAAVLAPLEFRPILRRLAYHENGQSSLRLPAIAAIAHCGEAADLGPLQQIVRTHPELSYAAQEAGISLTSRLGPATPDLQPK